MKTTGPGWSSRLRYLSVSGVLAVGLAAVCAARASAADVTKLNVGLSSAGNTSLAMFMAQAAGFYAERKLDVDMRVFDAGSRGAAEVQAGRLDAMHVGLSAVIELNRAGADLRLIASLVNVQRFSLYVAPDITTAADLKGGVMAVDRKSVV